MKIFKLKKNLHSLIIVVTIIIFSAVFISFDDTDDFDLAKNLDIYQTLIRELRLYYVDDIQSAKIIKTSIDEMLVSLDPYTVYYPESKIEDFKFMTTGQYGGVGAIIRKDSLNIIIDQVYKDYPADRAGIRPGDILKMVENKKVTNINTDDVSELLKGVPGTDVSITVFRPFRKQEISFTVKREKIQVKNVPYYGMINSETGYIKLTGFTQSAYEEVKEALNKLKKQNAKNLILDLRGNPGGLLGEAVKITSLFVNKGTDVVSTKGKVKQQNHAYKTKEKPKDTKIKIVVLVSRNSASAAEIVSGALQDLDRAVILGQRTYGKGLVQIFRDLSYNAKIKITTSKYYIPSGRCIQALDYTHRNPDGSVGHIPDTLISKFKTKNGRTVYDGGGILPDIQIQEKNINPLSKYLLFNFIIFDYANIYSYTHDTITKADDFEISDKEYNDFIEYVVKQNVKYKTKTDRALEAFIKSSKEEKFYDKLSNEIEQLQNDLKHDVRDDLIHFKSNIKELLSMAIITRYYYQHGVIEYSLENNLEISEALKVLADNEKYGSILKNP
ncbi:MAG: peptidase S41 [Bacteroidetes bacterium]|nr:MAG: peptidase S41 [Bacteroidota bacterium]